MAWRITDHVSHGEIDNRVKGRITGVLWLAGRPEAVRLDLSGNAWRDVAGCLLQFRNPHCQPVSGDTIAPHQVGVCGDMTASRKVKIPMIALSELGEHDLNEAIPSRWTNVLYLEWFGSQNGRVVVDGLEFEITVSEPAWRLTAEEEDAQRMQKAEAMDQFMDRLARTLVGEEFEIALLEFDAILDHAEEAGWPNESDPSKGEVAPPANPSIGLDS